MATTAAPSSPTASTGSGHQPARPTRTSFLTRITQYPTKPVSVVPYAPERLSITQDVFTPAMQEALVQSVEDDTKQTGEGSANTLMAALRMRRVMQKSKAGERMRQPTAKRLSEAQLNLERHNKVLSRYKIRRIDMVENETKSLHNLGWMMVNPHSSIYKVWQLSTLVLIIYQSILLPYGLAFEANQSGIMDTLTNLVFAWDIVVCFNTPVAASDDETDFITDRIQIAKIYIKGWLFFDLLASIPFDSVVLWISNYDSKTTGNLNVLGLLKALRIPRLLRLVRVLRVFKILRIRPEVRRWLQYSRHANLLRLVRLVISFLIINHYMACIWWGGVASDTMKAKDPDTSPQHLYVVSFYMIMLVIMGQNIDLYTDTEYIFCIGVMLFGAVVMAVVFGNVAILIANYYENQSSHQKKMEWLFASMTRMKLPMDLQNRINDYYQAMWERHGTLDGAVTAFIPELSRNLAYEVELFLRMDMINRAPIFQSCSAKVVQELVMELELQVFMPGDYVVVRGEVGNDMYFVQNGVCEVTKDVSPANARSAGQLHEAPMIVTNEIVLKTLGQGDYFGEIALLMNCKRTANVRAQVFSELCALTREVFESISLRYLEDRNIIERFIMDKYDPSMLQAAMKQSHELSTLRTSSVATGAASPTNASRVSFSRRTTTPSLDGAASSDVVELLRRIDDRLQQLEVKLEIETKERRESELRHSLIIQQQQQQQHPQQNEPSPPPQPRAANGFVLFEPERMSQRHLLSPLLNGHAPQPTATTDLTEDKVDDGIATDSEPDQKRMMWRRPSVHRSGSWRNARREGSVESLRLRGLVKPQASATVRHSSRTASLNAAIAAAEVMSIQHSMLRPEPNPRGTPESTTFSTDSLDDLASVLAQQEQRTDMGESRTGPTLDTPDS